MAIGRVPGVTGIQPSIVDAKGDLIVATAADSVSRLAVGANDTVLVADSAESTGLKWSGNWQTWTPIIGNFTLGNGTANYRYAQIGKTVFVDVNIIWGSTTSFSGGPNWSLPVSVKYTQTAQPATFLDAGTAYIYGRVLLLHTSYSYFVLEAINTAGTYATPNGISATVPFTWTTNDQINLQFSYEAA